MTIVVFFIVGVVIVTSIVDLLLVYLFTFHCKSYSETVNEPFVSILIAARNEETNIDNCINAVLALDYPSAKYEILVGDDKSEDSTLQRVNDRLKEADNLSVYEISENLGTAKGKANVLAQLAAKAKGEFLFITDADVIVPPSWIKSMLKGVKKNVGIVNGFTVVSDHTFQNVDWVLALGMVKLISDQIKPVTAIGNNMLVTREAYEAVGGYESIPFSITEDFELYKQVTKKGFKTRQLLNSEVKATTFGKSSFYELLLQRKRWMKGAVQLPFSIVLILVLQAVYYPLIIALFILNTEIALILAVIKNLVQTFFILMVSLKTREKISFLNAFLFEFYSMIIALSSSLFYILPFKIIWKGRKY